ncbi:MAG: methyltransferase type 12 [Chloroflexi bacterium RBG_16_56_8]|nr:MAG: methyltransferase type 12 [Chloroflexi bacterium RBG_16_56_8]
MNHTDHVNLLKPANLPLGGAWADFGAGAGAFTLALRELVGPDATIYAVDKDRRSLDALVQAHRALFGDSKRLHLLPADFTGVLGLPPLDGILMANSLHFFNDKEEILRHVRTFLKPNGTLLIVEYNVDSGNLWVPYPLSFDTYRLLASRAGFNEPRLLATVPSRFLHEFYSAAQSLEKARS